MRTAFERNQFRKLPRRISAGGTQQPQTRRKHMDGAVYDNDNPMWALLSAVPCITSLAKASCGETETFGLQKKEGPVAAFATTGP